MLCSLLRRFKLRFLPLVVAPCIKMPALAIEAEPVERAVGNHKIARRVQGSAGRLAVGDVQHAGMTHRDYGSPGMMSGEPFDHHGHAPRERVQAFSGFEIVVEVAGGVVGVGDGMACGAFAGGESLENPEMPLTEQRQMRDFEGEAIPDGARGDAGAAQVAAVNGVERVMRGVAGHSHRLGLASCIEGNVRLSLNSLFDIPIGFAVADEANAGGGHFVFIEEKRYVHSCTGCGITP